ncbi:hypothetical protein KDK95_28425, partial [Actinospica sp. MGRD01-02]
PVIAALERSLAGQAGLLGCGFVFSGGGLGVWGSHVLRTTASRWETGFRPNADARIRNLPTMSPERVNFRGNAVSGRQ